MHAELFWLRMVRTYRAADHLGTTIRPLAVQASACHAGRYRSGRRPHDPGLIANTCLRIPFTSPAPVLNVTNRQDYLLGDIGGCPMNEVEPNLVIDKIFRPTDKEIRSKELI